MKKCNLDFNKAMTTHNRRLKKKRMAKKIKAKKVKAKKI